MSAPRPRDTIPLWPRAFQVAPRPRSAGAIAEDLARLADEVRELDRHGAGDEYAEALLLVAGELATGQASLDHATARELEQLCAHCGHDQGEHLADEPHRCEAAENVLCPCPGFRAPGTYLAGDTERPPAPLTSEDLVDRFVADVLSRVP